MHTQGGRAANRRGGVEAVFNPLYHRDYNYYNLNDGVTAATMIEPAARNGYGINTAKGELQKTKADSNTFFLNGVQDL